jgi:hypothetical protein
LKAFERILAWAAQRQAARRPTFSDPKLTRRHVGFEEDLATRAPDVEMRFR